MSERSDNVLFEHPDSRESSVQILREEKIARGLYGNIFEAEVAIGDRTRQFIIKRFKEANEKGPQENAEKAFEHYKLAKKAGLKVFPTYRLGEDHESILMTDGRADDFFCLSSNNAPPERENVSEMKMVRIENFDVFLNDIFKRAIDAGKKGVHYRFDAPFFLIDKATRTMLDYYIGDLDHVGLIQNADMTSNNLYNTKSAIDEFLDKYVENPAAYRVEVDQIYKKSMIANKLPEA